MNILHIVSMVCFSLCLVMFFYLKWHIKQRTSALGLSEEHRMEINRLIADINNVTDRNLQVIEDSVTKLKTLLHEVDNRIALYEKDLENLSQLAAKLPAQREENSRRNETLYTSLGKGIRAALSNPKDAEPIPILFQPGLRQSEQQIIPSQLPLDQNPPAVSVNQAAGERPLKPPSRKQIRSHIDLMLGEGISPEEIASRLEISVAEVNLAMNLRRNK